MPGTNMSIKQSAALAIPDEQALAKLDEVAGDLRVLVQGDKKTPSNAVLMAHAVRTLRQLLTPEIMAPIMGLQNSDLGFRTDKPGGYDVDAVRDVTITCFGRGGQMTGNRTNIISARYYPTKEQFLDWLDEKQGRGKYMFLHGVPRVVTGTKMAKDKRTGEYVKKTDVIVGAVLESEVKWLVDGEWKSQTLTHAIKGDEYSPADAFCGKGDRKCGAWLYAQITGERVTDGEVDDDVIDITDSAVVADATEKDNTSPTGRTRSTEPTGSPRGPDGKPADELGL